jgi:hypothetical protein
LPSFLRWMLRRNMSTADCQKSGVEGKRLVFTLPFFQSAAMETHGLAGKMIAKMPKIARDCESPAT